MTTATHTARGSWRTPDAHRVLPADAERDRWLAERRKGIGGSEAAAVAGFDRWGSPREVFLDKLGLLPEKPQNRHMRIGILMEPVIAQLFTEETGIAVRRCGLLRSNERPWQQVSVDRLTADGGGLEIKNMGYHRTEEWGTEQDPQIPNAAALQAWHSMLVTGRSHWWVAGLLGGNNPVIRRVDRDEAALDQLLELEHDFWFGHVLPQLPPPVDGSEACAKLLKRYYPAAEGEEKVVDPGIIDPLLIRQAQAAQAVKDAEATQRLVENEMRDLAGTATELRYYGTDGKAPRPVATVRGNGTFNAKRFTEENPEVAAEYTRRVTVEQLDMDALKTEQAALYARYRARIVRITADGKRVVEAAAAAAAADSTTEKEVA